MEDRNTPEHEIEDRFVGLTAKIGYQKPNPPIKTQFEENLKCFINRKPPPLHLRKIDSSQLPKCHMCLEAFNQRPKLLIKTRYLSHNTARE